MYSIWACSYIHPFPKCHLNQIISCLSTLELHINTVLSSWSTIDEAEDSTWVLTETLTTTYFSKTTSTYLKIQSPQVLQPLKKKKKSREHKSVQFSDDIFWLGRGLSNPSVQWKSNHELQVKHGLTCNSSLGFE